MPTRKYNPGFLTDDELAATFCVRTSEFESITETLRENTGNSNQHVIVIGPRGSGKTSLLLRVAVEVVSALGVKLAPAKRHEAHAESGTPPILHQSRHESIAVTHSDQVTVVFQ